MSQELLAAIEADDAMADLLEGYLSDEAGQEPELADGATVLENIEPAVATIKQMVADFEQVGLDMGEPDADIDALCAKMDDLQTRLDACNGWEIDNVLERAMNARSSVSAQAARFFVIFLTKIILCILSWYL